jgi:C_GCAxxG_C_C family probable redox protein
MAEVDSEDQLLSELTDRVNRYYPISGNCAQTSFLALQEQFDLDGGAVLKALTPFPGIALRGETCGAVVGCLMALGLVFGRDELDDWAGYLSSLRPSRRFCREFDKEHGGTNCGDVLETHLGRRYNLADRTESSEYLAADGGLVCAGVVASAVHIAARAILRHRDFSQS